MTNTLPPVDWSSSFYAPPPFLSLILPSTTQQIRADSPLSLLHFYPNPTSPYTQPHKNQTHGITIARLLPKPSTISWKHTTTQGSWAVLNPPRVDGPAPADPLKSTEMRCSRGVTDRRSTAELGLDRHCLTVKLYVRVGRTVDTGRDDG